jgi:phosphohistidine phosphatase
VKIVLIRHAEAGDPDPVRYPDDRLRPLVPAGEEEHATIARGLAKLDLGVTHVFTSPFLRARQTAEITARAVGWAGTPVVTEALGDRFSIPALLEKLGRLPGDAVVLCFGHEPHLSRFAAHLLHRQGAVRIALAKSGAIALECYAAPAAGMARLVFMLPPEEMLRLLG